MANSSSDNKNTIGYWSVVAIGIGGMVGGGIFAVLGLAVELAKGGTPVAFAIAGVVAIFTSYSYAKLSARFPSQGGTVGFLNRAYGTGIFSGGLNVLLWLSYVIMLSLYAYAFGSYGASFFPAASQLLWKHILISAAIILFTGLNIIGAKAVARSENYIVAFKIIILLVFLVVGFFSIKLPQLQPDTWTGTLELIAGGMIIFVAYEGFELIANTAGNVKNPKKVLPLAYYSAVGFVIILYVLIAAVTVGNLPISDIVSAQDYALAAAARPFLGSIGFTMIAVAALLSTGSAINATLYGSARISYVIAKDGELPAQLEQKIWKKPIEGLLITSVLTLLVANLFDLSSISTMGSSGFLLIFAIVNIANIRLAEHTHSKKWLSICGAVLCLGAFVMLVIQRAMKAPEELIVLAGMLIVAFAIEVVYRRITGRTIKQIHRDM
jgi:amino acid transporter